MLPQSHKDTCTELRKTRTGFNLAGIENTLAITRSGRVEAPIRYLVPKFPARVPLLHVHDVEAKSVEESGEGDFGVGARGFEDFVVERSLRDLLLSRLAHL